MDASQAHRPVVQPRPLLITIAIHAALIILLLLWRFSSPAQITPLPETGMEVNLGTSADGSGADQPMDVEDPAAAASSSRNASSAANANTDVERSDEDDAPSLAAASAIRQVQARSHTTPPANGHTTVAATTPARNATPQRPRYVYPGSSGPGGNSAQANMPGSSEGNTTGSGDRGVVGGTPGAANYTGTPGSGTGGISYALGGRTMVAFPPKEAQFRQGGKVVVRVTVSRDGAIVNQSVRSTTNTELNAIALRKARQVRFNASDSAPEEQFGDITFVFKTRQ